MTIDNTETMSQLKDVAEQLKEPGVVENWLKGLLPGMFNFGLQIVLAIIIYVIGARLIKFARKIVRKWMERSNADLGLCQFMDALVKALLYILLAIMILTLFGVTTASVVALVGSAGVTIGLAMQGSLSNFAGGVLILMLKPFVVGDYIREDTHGNEGTVAEISIFYTKLLTVDYQTVVIPNGALSNSSLTNVTHSAKRRVDINVGVSYESDLRKAKDVIYQVAEKEETRIADEEITVFVSELEASDVLIGLRVWVNTEDYWTAKWRMTEKIKYALDENHIEIPYQKIDVQVKNQ